MPRPYLLVFATTLATASMALADAPSAGAGHAAGGRFAALDRNRDGVLDRAEAAAAPALAERFERIDRNGDQRLQPAELRKAARVAEARRELDEARRASIRARFAFLDTDGDRSLTLAEIGDDAPRLAGRFATIDRNRDGRIVPEELRDHLQAEREARRAARPG